LVENGPAARAGVQEGDIIVSMGENSVGSVDDLHRLLTEAFVGKQITLGILRGTELLKVDVVPEEAK
jgi:putative serine protease PepD